MLFFFAKCRKKRYTCNVNELTPHEIKSLNALTLAFVGDAVMTLRVRESLATDPAKVGDLHKRTAARICAAAQSAHFDRVAPMLDETERDIATRARNAKHHTVPKNASLADYIKATALEAVIGYNHLTGNKNRVEEILKC